MPDSEPVIVGLSNTTSSGDGSPIAYTDSESGVVGLESMNDDPPCIVGMACRLPGDVRSPSQLWDLVINQKTGQGPTPPVRYNVDGYYHPDGNRSGGINVPGGYFINEDIRQFDNGFFGINNLEATYMDPQQRKLLEVVFECFESAGASMQSMSGSNTGVYVGNFSVDYQPMQTRDSDYLHRYTSTGSGATIMSNRISHVFNLHGPSFTLDTACSSSVYALHQALTAIKVGDCESAIVASANLIMSPELHIGAAKSGVLSPTGTCHTFDASADGYGRAEGVNAIYVKRLSAALRDGNQIRAIVRGSAVNANGRTPGIALPSGNLQEAVMRKAYQNAGLNFAETDYVECHGTGTPVGDPIEVDAVGRCFFRPQGQAPLLIGSVKTNIGHSEAASGLTSVLKVVTAFEKGQIPPTHGLVKLNPKLIPILEQRNLKVVTQADQWPRALRRASVNSFGYGGANAHVILESADSYLSQYFPGRLVAQKRQIENSDQAVVLPVSAASSKSLETRVQDISQAVLQLSDAENLQNLAYTLTSRRDHLRHKSFLLAKYEGSGKLVEVIEDVNNSSNREGLPFGFVFTGQGAQYAGMAKELLAHNRQFRDTIRRLDDVLKALPDPYAPDWTLEQTLLDGPTESRINEVTRSQPICTALQVGLVDLLRSWGVSPTAVVGHSSGEIAAAYAAGLLNSTQAILVAYFRGYSVGKLQSQGTMMAAGVSDQTAKSLIEAKDLQENVRVACVNAPESVTLSGASDGIEALRAEFQDQKKFARKLETGGRAYHSHMMKEIGALYQDLLTPLFADANSETPAAARMYSSVGHSTDDLRVLEGRTDWASYWRQNLEQPVQFSGALASLAEKEGSKLHLIEVGPHSALKGPIQQIRTSIGLDKNSLPYAPSLVRKEDADECLKKLAGTLFVHGHAIDWNKINSLPESGHELVPLHDLAPYPWDYSAPLNWAEPRASVELRNRKYLRHELLGTFALTGNGIDFTWRNLIRPKEMPWFSDHKLETSVVFPAAGYLAVAIEAVSQATGTRGKLDVAFEFRNVNITAALIVPPDNDPAAKDLELHTTMSLRKLSTVNTSADWHDFTVSSWAAGETTIHCAGSIRVVEPLTESAKHVATTTVDNGDGFEESPTNRWYQKWDEEGLCFGPYFQSLTSLRTDSERTRSEAIASLRLAPEIPSKSYIDSYPVHPITIDACFQAAILGGTAGHLPSLRAWMPVFISECRIQPSAQAATSPELEAVIHTRSEEVGFSSRRIDATLRDARGVPVVNLRDARMSLYTGKSSTVKSSDGNNANPIDKYMQRQPTLRVHWKPDVARLHPGTERQLQDYVTAFVDQQPLDSDLRDDESIAVIAALVDLAGHKHPRMRVLELGGDDVGYKAKQWLGILNKETAFARCQSWQAGVLDDNGEIVVEGDGEDTSPFDVVVVPRNSSSKQIWSQDPESIASLVSDNGIVVARKSNAAVDVLKSLKFNVLPIGQSVILALRPPQLTSLQGRNALIVLGRNPSSTVAEFANTLAAYLRDQAGVALASIVPLDRIDTTDVSENDVAISLLETEREFLATISPEDMDRLRAITDVVRDLLWVTGANMLGSVPDPNLTLSNGLSRALMLEQPALRYTVLDIGPVSLLSSTPNAIGTCENALRALVINQEKDDSEFIQRDGILHISRFGPDQDVNSLFRRRLEPLEALEKQTLATAGIARLSVGRPGATDSMFFQQLSSTAKTAPDAGYVDIEVKAVGLNAKDVYAMAGRVETRNLTTALDFSGVVTAVGDGVEHLSVGDRVVAWAPNHFTTTERVPVGSVHKLLDHEELTIMSTLITVYGTALYAFNQLAHLRAGESVLIHAGSGGLGFAAITLAQKRGAIVYTTAGSKTKRDYLVNELGVPDAHIFNSRDASFVEGILEITNGRGVDVVLNSLTGDLLHASWACLATFGRFVEVGKRELVDAGKLDMRVFLRSCTFTAFDLSEFFYAQEPHNRAVWDGLMAQVIELYRAGDIQAPPIKVFGVSEITQAYRTFTQQDRIGKIVISLENPQARIPVVPAAYLSIFDPEKVYLLIGCLGGLGRSLSRWMMSRGARHFVFLGRSGADKPSAQQLVSRLQSAGANVDVVRGDVSRAADVTAAVAASLGTGRQIGGVVQAAMGLHEALFTRMPNKAWHTGIDPKWQGTWNLHNALQGHDDALDFFLLTSSVSGTVGTATESNYCAANGFLDSFARWRRSQGKPAVAVGLGMISEVGYLHENPEIEALLLRKGIQPLNEDEFLQVLDLALLSEAAHNPGQAHLLTGLEPAGVRQLKARGFDVSNHGVLTEARAALLAASLAAEQEVLDAQNSTSSSSSSSGSNTNTPTTAAPWFKELPGTATSTFASEADAESLNAAVLRLIKKRFSNLILMPLEQIDERKALPQFGVDSMIASEFRTWFYTVFKVDIPFLDLMSAQKSLEGLAGVVEGKLVEGWK